MKRDYSVLHSGWNAQVYRHSKKWSFQHVISMIAPLFAYLISLIVLIPSVST